MTKRILFGLVLIFSSFFSAFAINNVQGNFLDPQRYSFEDGGSSCYYQQTADYWTVTSEKSTEGGNYCLKFSSDAALTGTQKAKNGGINIPAGTYTFKVKVWKVEGSEITGFSFNLKTPWIPIAINTASIETDKWVEISIPITFEEDIVNSAVIIPIGTANVGKGTLYVDDFGFWGEKEPEPVKIPAISSIQTVGEAQLNLGAGIYNVSMKVWKENTTSISKLYSSISNPWALQEWEIDTLTSNTWSTIGQEVLLQDTSEDATFKLFVNNYPEHGGGKGTIYVDDVKFTLLDSYRPVTAMSLSESSIELWKEQQYDLNYTIEPLDANVMSIKWISADPTVATVDSTGKVTAMDKGTTSISLFSGNNFLLARCQVKVNVDDTKKVEVNLNHIQLFPNPFKDNLSILLGKHEFDKVQIFSLSGKLLMKKKITTKTSVELNPSYETLPRGNYLLRFYGSETVSTLKIIRQ